MFDVERDREQRPRRPITRRSDSAGASQDCRLGAAGAGRRTGGRAADILPNDRFPATWVPAAIGVALAVMIVAYDGPLKTTLLAPAAMGGCRVLSFLLGASPCSCWHAAAAGDGPLFPKYVVAIALGFGIYIMGITTMARHEATGGPSPNLSTRLVVDDHRCGGFGVCATNGGGQVRLAHLAERRVSDPDRDDRLSGDSRGLRASERSHPGKDSNLVRVGILTMIPLAAAFAFLGAGPVLGFGRLFAGDSFDRAGPPIPRHLIELSPGCRGGPGSRHTMGAISMMPGFHVGGLLLHRQSDARCASRALGFRCVAIRPRPDSLDPRDPHFGQQVVRMAAAIAPGGRQHW